MDLTSFLSNCTTDELTQRLLMLDKSLMDLHQHGYFVVGDLPHILITDDKITLESFQNKLDYLNSGYNANGDKQDILEMCAIGICAYNHFQTFYTNKEFLSYLMENLEIFLENGNVPSDIADYYRLVLINGNIDYLNSFFMKNASSSKDNVSSLVYNKSTAVGRALADKDAAFVNVLLIPSIMVLMYLFFIVMVWLWR